MLQLSIIRLSRLAGSLALVRWCQNKLILAMSHQSSTWTVRFPCITNSPKPHLVTKVHLISTAVATAPRYHRAANIVSLCRRMLAPTKFSAIIAENTGEATTMTSDPDEWRREPYRSSNLVIRNSRQTRQHHCHQRKMATPSGPSDGQSLLIIKQILQLQSLPTSDRILYHNCIAKIKITTNSILTT